MRRSGSSASSGQSSMSAGHQACASCSWSGVTSAPVGQPGLADEHAPGWWGRRTSASPRTRSGATDHSSSQLADERLRPGSRRGRPRRRRPAPSGRPRTTATAARRPASQRPSASRVTHSAATPCEASPSTSRSAQRAGCSSRTRPPSSLGVADQARGDAVVARGAALAQRGDRGVGGGDLLGLGLEGSSRQRATDVVDLPRPAREDAGLPASPGKGTVRVVVATVCAAVGMGLRGPSRRRPRCAPPPRGSSGPRLRLDGGRGPVALEDVALPAPRARRARQRCFADDVRARVTCAQGLLVPRRRAARSAGGSTTRRTGRVRAHGGRRRARCSSGRPTRTRRSIPYGGGTSVVGGVSRGSRIASTASSSLDLGGARCACSRSTPSRAPRGSGAGAAGPRVGAQLARARDDDALLPAVVRALDARRLDRDARGRALRDRRHARRRPRRVGARDHAVRRVGVAAAARVAAPAPSPDRMLLGSEGILGVITEAWVRVQPRPELRASRGRALRRVPAAAPRRCARSRSPGCGPSNCRLIDAARGASRRGAGDGIARAARARLRVDGGRPVDELLDQAASRSAATHGGEWDEPSALTAPGGGSVGAWRDAFLRAPYLRDAFVAMGVLSETFETAITWERFAALHEAVAAARARARSATRVPRHLPLHARLSRRRRRRTSPSRARAPRRGGRAVGARSRRRPPMRCIAAGGTITHHHAVGRDHRPWYDRQRPDVVRDRAARGEGGGRPGRDAQPRRAGRLGVESFIAIRGCECGRLTPEGRPEVVDRVGAVRAPASAARASRPRCRACLDHAEVARGPRVGVAGAQRDVVGGPRTDARDLQQLLAVLRARRSARVRRAPVRGRAAWRGPPGRGGRARAASGRGA